MSRESDELLFLLNVSDEKVQRLFERRLCFLWEKAYFTIAVFLNVEEDGFRVHAHQGKGGLCLLRVQPPEMGEDKYGNTDAAVGSGGEGEGIGGEGGPGVAAGVAGARAEETGAKGDLHIPPFLKVRKEVTRDPQYHSRYLSLKDKTKCK